MSIPDNNGNGLPDGSQLNPSDPKPAAGNPAPTPTPSPEAMTLAEINEHLGKTFPNKETALKALKDTFSYVGKKKEDIETEVRAAIQKDDRFDKLAGELAQERTERFYLQNPQYAPHRKLIESLGKDPAQVVQGDVFKETFTRLEEHGKTVKLRTVLESNPRLAASRDSLSKASELKKSQNGIVTEDVETLATRAVIDAFGLDK